MDSLNAVQGLGKVGIGVIGAGVIFNEHARAIRSLADRCRMVAVSDLDRAKLESATQSFFVPHAFTDYEQLLARDDVSLVIVCTPPHTHERIVTAALAAGKHVCCEKPMAHTLGAADRMIAAAEGHPGRLSVVYQLRYLDGVRRTRWLLEEGHLGRVFFGSFHRMSRIQNSKASSSGWWGRWSVAGGGAMMTQFVHQLDLICEFFGTPESVIAEMDTFSAGIESEDTCSAQIRFASGALVTCSSTVAAHRVGWTYEIVGTDGTVSHPWSFSMGKPETEAAVRKRMLAAIPDPPKAASRSLPARAARRLQRVAGRGRGQGNPVERSGHANYLAAVVEAMQRGEALPIGPREARRSIELCAGIYTSALSGRRVTFPLDPNHCCYNGIETDEYNGGNLRGRAVNGHERVGEAVAAGE